MKAKMDEQITEKSKKQQKCFLKEKIEQRK